MNGNLLPDGMWALSPWTANLFDNHGTVQFVHRTFAYLTVNFHMPTMHINNLFNNVSNLKCKSYITGKTKADFTEPMYTVTLTGPKTYTLSIFEKINEEDDTYPAISSENDYPFMLPAYKMDNMVKK